MTYHDPPEPDEGAAAPVFGAAVAVRESGPVFVLVMVTTTTVPDDVELVTRVVGAVGVISVENKVVA